jgi:hypothetical protein
MRRFTYGFHRISCLLFLAASTANADDWPNWRGPHGNGISRETNLAKSWPASGPRALWKMDLTGGYSSVVVAARFLLVRRRFLSRCPRQSACLVQLL